jgi:hypothetical protein
VFKVTATSNGNSIELETPKAHEAKRHADQLLAGGFAPRVFALRRSTEIPVYWSDALGKFVPIPEA